MNDTAENQDLKAWHVNRLKQFWEDIKNVSKENKEEES
jgi:hypothetical protein